MVTKYYLQGDKVTLQESGSDKTYFTYDGSGHLVSMNLNGTEYFYVRNAQGDIIGLIDSAGTRVVSYSYDTWGKLLATSDSSGINLGAKNPYRYRGYRYDTDTGLYYLQSRYYNPEWGRFLNADGLVGTPGELLSGNMFAYCMNNPVNMSDPSGNLPTWAKWTIGAAVIVGLGVAVVASAGTASPLIALALADPMISGAFIGAASYGAMGALTDGADGFLFGTTVGAIQGGLEGAAARGSGGSTKSTHGNSKLSTKTQHGYEIYENTTGDVVKTGISGRPLNQNGTSPRANTQVNKLNSVAGFEKFSARVVKTNLPNRQAALDWEVSNAMSLWENGNSMNIHKRPIPWDK